MIELLNQDSTLQRLKNILLWSDTHLLELCLGLTLLAKSTYGATFRGYPMLMLLSGTLIALYSLFSTISKDLNHRHRGVSLMAVYYASHIYAQAFTVHLPITRILYLILTLLLPPLYLKWRLYREKIYREN